MSHKVLILSLVMTLLLVTLIMPASVAHREVGQVQTPVMAAWSVPGGSFPVLLPIWLQPNGGCEDGAASGCPNPH